MPPRVHLDTLRTAACMALLSLLVVSIGEASAHSRESRGDLTTRDRVPLVTIPGASPEMAARSSKPVRVVYPHLS